ncbi:MAG: M48 family metallopeptidase [Mariprofundaceae bacterium]|nr:M48 family metallopeptidase [Mariprofundaceae bacterium]
MTMNLFAIIILSTLLLSWLLETLASLLNLRAVKKQADPELSDLMPSAQYKKSTDYIRAKTIFSFLSSASSLFILVAFWACGGFAWLDQWVLRFDFNPILTGILFIGILILAGQFTSLPFTLYNTFKLEARFGFNRTTLQTFVSDRIKGFGLLLFIGTPILAMVLFFFETLGAQAWLYAWLAMTSVALLMQYLAPRYLMPLFNKYQDLEEGELRQKIMAFAHDVDFTVTDIYIMDGSKRSSKGNAFFTGFGKNRRIALFDTLIEKLSHEELLAVLAHEIGHYKKKHMIQSTLLGIVQTGLMMYVLSICLGAQGLFDAFGLTHLSVYAGLVFFSLLYSPVDMLTSLGTLYLSRKNEYEADAFAVGSLQKSETLISALKKLSVDHLSHQSPHPLHVCLHDSHPPLLQRIHAMRKHLSD